ncbi:glycosyltransferase [Bacterioplanoides pacificum]|uniref:Glycosyltransferase n=1 Tax=Bacterioplanoides pacificum TaxID=1171596 RepID=A0ABV7VPY9_9GAMM
MKDNNPLVSIVVPVYNSERYLSECIESILNQNYANIELIIVNDGSTDNSLSIAEQFSENDSRIKILSQSNSGVSAARNLGISIAQGDYIGFVDSDDAVHEKMYEELLSRIIKDRTDMAVLKEYVVRQGSPISDKTGVLTSKEALNRLLLLTFPTSLWAYLYKAETIKPLALDEDVHFFEDFLFNFQALLNVEKVSVITGAYYEYRSHDENTNSHGVSSKRLTCLFIVDEIYDFLNCRVDLSFLRTTVIFSESHFLVSVLLPIKYKDLLENKVYVRTALSRLKSSIGSIFFSNVVPLKYKGYLLLASLNIRILIFVMFMGQQVRKIIRLFKS